MYIKKIVYVFSFVLIFSQFAYSQVTNEQTVNFSIDAHCSANAEINSQCFNMSESQCRSIFNTAFVECSQDSIPLTDQLQDSDKKNVFDNCVADKVERYLVDQGVNLDEQCN